MMLVCVCSTQAAIVWLCLPLSHIIDWLIIIIIITIIIIIIIINQ